jgi:hypothetical protein
MRVERRYCIDGGNGKPAHPLPSLFFSLAIISLILIITITIHPAWADDEFGEGRGRGAAVALGWVSIGSGLLANVPFLLYVKVKKVSVSVLGGGHQITRGLAVQHPAILNFHMTMNLIGFAAGAAHGTFLLGGLDAISLSLAIVMTLLVASGLILRFSSGDTRNFTKILHSQIVLMAALIVLIGLHVLSMGGFD